MADASSLIGQAILYYRIIEKFGGGGIEGDRIQAIGEEVIRSLSGSIP